MNPMFSNENRTVHALDTTQQPRGTDVSNELSLDDLDDVSGGQSVVIFIIIVER